MRWWTGLMVVALVGTGWSARGDEPATTPLKLPELQLQVQALTTFDELDLTDQQLHALRRMADQTAAGAPVAATEPAMAGYVSDLTQLRLAFINEDENLIVDLQDKIDALSENDNIPSSPDVEVTNGARQKAERALKLLTTGQVVNYLSEHSDDVPSPVETILDAMDQARGTTGEAYDSIRKEACEQVAMIVLGIAADGSDLQQKIGTLLDKAHGMNDTQYDNNQDRLENEARKLIGDVDPVLGIRHWMEREMADLLSNPQLDAAIDAKLKNQ